MTRPAKRATTLDYRARSPKRRKTTITFRSKANDLTEDASNTEKTDLAARFNVEENIFPVDRILGERGVGAKKEYLLAWDPHPINGTTYLPTWESKDRVGTALLQAWGEEKKKTKEKEKSSKTVASGASSLRALPSLAYSPSPSDGLKPSVASTRIKRNRPVIADSSSVTNSDFETAGGFQTPSLALSATSSPDEDWDPASPLAEILETQEQAHAQPIAFSITIPKTIIDKADYLSYHGSQRTPAETSPFVASSPEISQSGLEFSSTSWQRGSQSSPSQQLQNNLYTAHQSLLQAVESRTQASQPVEVPASSNEKPKSDAAPVLPHSSSLIVQESSSALDTATRGQELSSHLTKRTSHQGWGYPPFGALGSSSQANNLFSSAQPASQGNRLLEGYSLALEPIDTTHEDSQLSALAVLQTQLSPLSPILSEPRQLKKPRGGQLDSKAGRLDLVQNGADSQIGLLSSRLQSKKKKNLTSIEMDSSAVRHSPRLQAATLASGSRASPRPTAREQLRRAATPQNPDDDDTIRPRNMTNQTQSYGSHLTPDARPSSARQNHPYGSGQVYQEPALSSSNMPQPAVYDIALGASALPIQQSIEDEPSCSAEEHNSIASKASSSQVSLQYERALPQVDGISLPNQPVIGSSEYAIPLPAEGKIQSSYIDLINSKRKTILKFIHRRDSVGSANGHPSRTVERNEMIELMDLLHDSVTHFDLGLAGFVTQYSIQTEEAAAYAQYAGSKFVFLGHLIDILMRVDCSLIVAAKPGAVQELLVNFLKMKRVHVHRFDRPGSSRSVTPDVHQATLKVDIISTSSEFEINVSPRPVLMISFDSSFDSQSPHIARIRELNSTGRNRLLPVLHLLVQNSSEHVDRCLRKAMPSPQRLKLLVRAAYQARTNLGGSPSYVPAIGDEPEGRPMDLHDLQRGVRKSPNRKLNMVAAIVARAALSEEFAETWSLGDMPEVQYEELEETPPKSSRVTTSANTATATPRDGRARSRTPLSRAGTPSGRKRLLEVEGASSALSKRARLSPARDLTPTVEAMRENAEVEYLREQLRAVTADLATEKEARLKAEEARDYAQRRVEDYVQDHESLLRRYEKRRSKTRGLDAQIKQLQSISDFNRTKHERTVENNTKLKEQIAELKTELVAAREDLKKEGGDLGALEEAKEELRSARDGKAKLEKSIENTKRDFEFTRQQYQQASSRAAELGGQNSELEEQVEALKIQASDEKRRLREVNAQVTHREDLAKVEALEQENRGLQVMMKKMEERIKVLEKGRGVQTRGSSVQPPGSPGIGQTQGYGTRSRQGSPALGTVLSSSRDAREAMSGRDRVSGLRNER